MRLGLFGGSFDPVHAGHLAPVVEARRLLGLDRILYLPTGRPPHKPRRRMAPAAARYAMVEMAILGLEGLYASPFELGTEPAYTVETLEHFHRLHPEADLHLLVGTDSVAELTTWREWRRIPELATVAALGRPGSEVEAVRTDLPEELIRAAEQGRLVFLDTAPVAVSSSEIRDAYRRRERPPAGALPDLVLQYIDKYRFYDEESPG